MTRFNNNTPKQKSITTNLAGGESYKLDPKIELLTLMVNSHLKDQFYRTETATVDRLVELINSIDDKEFVAKLTVYVRVAYGNRTITHVVAGELAHIVKNDVWMKYFFQQVVYRVDDALEIISYYKSRYGETLPNSLKKGIALALTKFDAYQIAKYRAEHRDLKLIDVVRLTHPKETKAIKDLVYDKLKNVKTTEAILSNAGQRKDVAKEVAKEEAWQDLVLSKKIGYLALLKNLKNIAKESNVLTPAIEMLTDETLIKKSLVYPFRYMTAYEEITGGKYKFDKYHGDNNVVMLMKAPNKALELSVNNVPAFDGYHGDNNVVMLMKALNKALELSVNNVPAFDGKVLICVDDSGSMEDIFDKASVVAGCILKANPGCDLMFFNNDSRFVQLNPDDTLTTLIGQLKKSFKSGGTNFPNLVSSWKKHYDIIIVISDEQGWAGGQYGNPLNEYKTYCANYGEPFLFSYDLSGLGTSMFNTGKIFTMGGFSSESFDMMKNLTSDKKVLLEKVDEIDFGVIDLKCGIDKKDFVISNVSDGIEVKIVQGKKPSLALYYKRNKLSEVKDFIEKNKKNL